LKKNPGIILKLSDSMLFVRRAVAGASLGAAMVALAACNPSAASSSQSANSRESAARPVKIARAAEVPMERVIPATGSLAPFNRATLSMKVSGRLESIAVDVGSPVQRGQRLAQIEVRDYELRVRQAEAALAQSRALLGLPLDGPDDAFDPEQASSVKQARALLHEAQNHRDRMTRLTEDQILSVSDLERAEAAFEVALNRYHDALQDARGRHALLLQRRAELDMARQQLDGASLVAPFDGVVQDRRASPGEFLSAGTPVLTLVQIDPLRLRLEVAERDAPKVRAGQAVRFTVEGDTNCLTGRLSRITPALGERNRMLLVEADIANDGWLRPGSFVRAEIMVDAGTSTLAVPKDSIVTFAGIDKVILVESGKAIERRVSIGRSAAEQVEILSGIREGDMVVLNPGNLQTGNAVFVQD
jgi:RND family efflux transporter MFP subunit